MDYKELTKRIKANISKEYRDRREQIARDDARTEAQQRAIDKKQQEKRDVKRAGGGHAIARRILMGKDTDFNYGANEVPDNQQTIPDEAYPCNGSVKCTVCGKHLGYHAEIEEEKKMLPTGNESNNNSRGNRRQSNQVWLKNEDLSLDVQHAKIINVRYNKEGRFGARVEMKLALGGKTLFWGVPPKVDDKNPNYKELLAAFGPDENDWVDKTIGLFLEQDEWSGNYFPRVVIDKEEPANQEPAPATTGRTSRKPRG
jgi:hypothetical protein